MQDACHTNEIAAEVYGLNSNESYRKIDILISRRPAIQQFLTKCCLAFVAYFRKAERGHFALQHSGSNCDQSSRVRKKDLTRIFFLTIDCMLPLERRLQKTF